jgi:hypothetical protein
LEHLIDLRRKFLPGCDAVIAVSDFIAQTQSRLDAPGTAVSSNLNGADHMEHGLWIDAGAEARSSEVEKLIASLRVQNSQRRIVINLGRWEPGCYKNSEAVLRIAV